MGRSASTTAIDGRFHSAPIEDIRNITYNGERSQIPRRQLSGHHSAPRPSLASLRRDVIATSSSRTSREHRGFLHHSCQSTDDQSCISHRPSMQHTRKPAIFIRCSYLDII